MSLKSLLLIIFVLGILGCKKSSKKIEWRFPKIENNCSLLKQNLDFEQGGMNINFFYYGKHENHIEYDKKLNRNRMLKGMLTPKIEPNSVLDYSKTNIDFKVDTTQTITITEYLINKTGNRDSLIFKSFPVCFYNLGSKNGIIKDYYLPLELEVKYNSKWYNFRTEYYFCGFEFMGGSVTLPANNMLCTKIPYHEGPIKLKFRVRMGINHSNEFDGGISQKDFDRTIAKTIFWEQRRITEMNKIKNKN